MLKRTRLVLGIVLLILGLVACSTPQEPPPANQAPAAQLNAPTNAEVGIPLMLNASASSDPDGDSLTYIWELISQPTCSNSSLVNTAGASVQFTPDVPGDYVFELTVSDSRSSDSATVTIQVAPTVLARSTFDSGDEGWQIFGDAQGATAQPTYSATGGNPGGFLSAQDDVTGGYWYWEAPETFLGDQCAAYGGNLGFDLRQSDTSSQSDRADVILRSDVNGEIVTLVLDTAENPGTDWTSYTIALKETAGWTKETLTGPTPTAAEMRQVLSNLSQLLIRGEYRVGEDVGSLDNPTLVTTTLPAADSPKRAAQLSLRRARSIVLLPKPIQRSR